MLITKNFSLKRILLFSGHHFPWLILWMTLVVALYVYTDDGHHWMFIPWLPVSIIGTAVAFYVGFKNNSAYDRMWEARKIWGAIVNSSRSWGNVVRNYTSNLHNPLPVDDAEIKAWHQKLIFRHIAWLYALRSQLLVATPWEHSNQRGFTGSFARRYQRLFGVGLVDDEVTRIELQQFLGKEEHDHLIAAKNTATQIIFKQGEDLKKLRDLNLIDDFRHMEMQKILNDFYDHQGKCERIKKFPLPRQYANMSFIFVCIFIFLMPFGLVPEFAKFGNIGIWMSIPFLVIVGWLYVVMEIVGDYSENPFQGMANDIPMLSLCRTIEIDLLEMLGETDLPAPIEAKKGILM
ncbi:hypothetical protein H4K34_01735 [Croceimicrobium hydrocarbonivorans]|uniref:Multidrug transporter n=2 Tax=Croceimicrobium hydrocarbonivorans TaxID=2761580 RepID=A0A7H0VFU0_9FLAO|nr:hypothetical protein H4K34_01735 [Croceimicrobium hydrocarbonivorans]